MNKFDKADKLSLECTKLIEHGEVYIKICDEILELIDNYTNSEEIDHEEFKTMLKPLEKKLVNHFNKLKKL